MTENEETQSGSPIEKKAAAEGKKTKRAEEKRKRAPRKPEQTEEAAEVGFPVVAVGASAGGLRAIEAFLVNLPEAPGMAVVILQHQAPDRESIMSSLLKSYTSLPVVKIENDMPVQPDRVYVRPPDKKLWFFRI